MPHLFMVVEIPLVCAHHNIKAVFLLSLLTPVTANNMQLEALTLQACANFILLFCYE